MKQIIQNKTSLEGQHIYTWNHLEIRGILMNHFYTIVKDMVPEDIEMRVEFIQEEEKNNSEEPQFKAAIFIR